MHLLIDIFQVRRFLKNVTPILRARGVQMQDDEAEACAWIKKWFEAKATLWAAVVQMPQVGQVLEVKDLRYYEGGADLLIYDGRVRNLRGIPPDATSARVEISYTYGLRITAAVSAKKLSRDPMPMPQARLMISRFGVTAMAERVPGLDVAEIVDMWADEQLPGFLAGDRPETPFLVQDAGMVLSFRSPRGIDFASRCSDCKGDGSVICHVCAGTKLVTCKKCEGRGQLDCKRCNRSGIYKFPNGDTGYCRNCNGTGHKDCYCCDGNRQLQCHACQGSGTSECRRCHATGCIPVFYRPLEGGFFYPDQMNLNRNQEPVSVENVYLFDFEQKEKVPCAGQTLTSLLSVLEERRSRHRQRIAGIDNLVSEFRPIITCLENSCDAAGVLSRDPIRLADPQATTKRQRHHAIYAFSMVKPVPKWLNKGIYPFPCGTPLHLDPMPVYSRPLPEKAFPRLHSIDFEKRRMLVAFPVAIDRQCLPDGLTAKPDIPQPSEKCQIKALQSWLTLSNRHNPVFEAMAFPAGTKLEKLASRRGTANHKATEKQRKAIHLGLSHNVPLVLVKGPPGTGKTTVIVDVLLQATKMGQRVLVTSQTHQAVRNVLELLHKIGGVPMVRHGDEAKLSEVERKYRRAYSTDEPTDICSRAQSILTAKENILATLMDDISILQKAHEEGELLNQKRLSLEQARQSLEKRIGQAVSKQNLAFDREDSAMAKKLDHDTSPLKDLAGKLSKDLTGIESAIVATEHEIESIENRLKRSSDSFLKNLATDVFGHKIHPALATKQELHRRLKNAQGQLKDHKVQHAQHTANHQQTQRQINEFKQQYTLDKREIDKRRSSELQRIDQERTAECAVLDKEKRQVEIHFHGETKPFCAVLKRRRTSADQTGTEPTHWRECLETCRTAERALREELLFCQDWVRDITSHPEAVGTFLNHRVRAFFSTCVGLAGWRALDQYGLTHFDLVIVDEAGHATIPETLIPLNRAKRAMLIGDDRQLPPIVAEELSCRSHKPGMAVTACVREENTDPCWLEVSLFERLWVDKKLDLPRVMLDVQFRMHPVIGDFISATFYEGLLSNGVTQADRIFSFGEFRKPVCLVPTMAYGRKRHEESVGTSWRNHLEAAIVKRILAHLLRHAMATPDGESAVSVGVITPYSAQCALLQDELDTHFGAHSRLLFTAEDIASVDRFQGSERDVIIVSFVRSPQPCTRCQGKGSSCNTGCPDCHGTGLLGPSLRFVQDLKRMNVAFSRAKKMLILVGDIDALCQGRGSESGRDALRRFREYVLDCGRVLHVWEKESINE